VNRQTKELDRYACSTSFLLWQEDPSCDFAILPHRVLLPSPFFAFRTLHPSLRRPFEFTVHLQQIRNMHGIGQRFFDFCRTFSLVFFAGPFPTLIKKPKPFWEMNSYCLLCVSYGSDLPVRKSLSFRPRIPHGRMCPVNLR
jgi:hypothetical protein